MSILCHGSIVWIEVTDSRGNVKTRPVVVVSGPGDIANSQSLVGVACSHSAAVHGEASPYHVELPFHAQRKVRTKLGRPTVAVCNWLVEFDRKDIRINEGGVVPPQVLLEILSKLPDCDEGKPSQPWS